MTLITLLFYHVPSQSY